MPGRRQPEASPKAAHAGPENTIPKLTIDFPVVGIGASAGGLEACTQLAQSIPADFDIACVLIQHLDPTHKSMMVDLLAKRTLMRVLEPTDGMPVERRNFYIIPPGMYLSVKDGALWLSKPPERHGARLPFDYLLNSLAQECKDQAICVVLSGTGADGSAGLKTVKQMGGLVIAQDPDEAGYDGMPRSAIATGLVDFVLPVSGIASAILRFNRDCNTPQGNAMSSTDDLGDGCLAQIISLLRTKTQHDFTSYKRGTLQRRIERRIAMTSVKAGDLCAYMSLLRDSPAELDLLAKDLLINVTSFFRDRKVFDLLAGKMEPKPPTGHPNDDKFRIWVAGCSTGEEAYSIAMIFLEEMSASNRNMKLQIFASDADPDAIAKARAGLYSETISADVSAERLARFFTREEGGYRVSSELRSAVVFTVQDVLVDPPFSRIDFVSCRNLLIYLLPEAQAKVISVFHFSLREGGLLLLGSSETIGNSSGSFEVVSKTERLFRRIGGSRHETVRFSVGGAENSRAPARVGIGATSARPALLATLCQRLVADDYGPAAALINQKGDCLYLSGPTDNFLKLPSGNIAHDLISMAREGVHAKLRSAISRAATEKEKVRVTGGRMIRNGVVVGFTIEARPIAWEGEKLLLIYFIAEPEPVQLGETKHPSRPEDASRVAELELEIEAARAELRDTNQHLVAVSEEQKAINEEALSVNEEYQSANEELTTSKEELQSLNEELTALNSQLQETLERQRTTSDDLQNVLYSTDVATLFLDKALNIRFFTPETTKLFSVLPSDIGRPLADLRSLSADGDILTSARAVLKNSAPLETEIKADTGAWYLRRILPYRASDTNVEGVVITFVDVTDRRHASEALDSARRAAHVANLGKSRFLAVASHDLRQPLQTFVLLQGLLAKSVQTDKDKKLVARLGDAASAMSGMLDALLDINQIEAGAVHPSRVMFPINDLFNSLREEFTYHAHAKRLALHVVPCGLSICSDPRLISQMLRNLVMNALKYTKDGTILVGSRRRRGSLSIEVWDTGIGIPEAELQSIFEEYHQLDNAARERSRGLGLGLFIVQSLAKLLNHKVTVRSRLGRGSGFAIEIKQPEIEPSEPGKYRVETKTADAVEEGTCAGAILIVEDDPDVRELLEQYFRATGFQASSASDGLAALAAVSNGQASPDCVLVDYNLPNGMDGLEVISRVRARLARAVPAIVLTGDISTKTMRLIASFGCQQFNKPVNLEELNQSIKSLLAGPTQEPRTTALPPAATNVEPGLSTVFVVDDDAELRASLRLALEEESLLVEDFSNCQDFLDMYQTGRKGCLLIDAYLPGMSGLELLKRLAELGNSLPSIMITGNGDVPMAVQAMKAGVIDFIEKPVSLDDLLASVKRALESSADAGRATEWREAASRHMANLTSRQRQIMDLVLAGHPSKNIAADLGISQRTVENHRASIMKRTGAKSLPALARMAMTAAWQDKSAQP